MGESRRVDVSGSGIRPNCVPVVTRGTGLGAEARLLWSLTVCLDL